MEMVLERWGRFVARWPLLIVAVWIALILAALHTAPSLDAVAQRQNTSSLPASASSVRASALYATKFAAGKSAQGKEADLIILTDPQGISAADIQRAEQISSWLTDPTTRPTQLLSVAGPSSSQPGAAFESSDGQALRLILTWDVSQKGVPDAAIAAIDTYLSRQSVPPGGTLALTGSTPITHDLTSSLLPTSSSKGGANAGSILGLLIILLVLGAVYRSPLAVIVPLVTVGMSVVLAVPLIAWSGAHLGVTVASFSLQYVAFVTLGAGTNYSVFMLSRYKEEIRRGTEQTKAARRQALARTVGRVGESISSSATTVVVATAIMGLAQLYTLRVTGPAVAIGVVCLLLAGLSLLPALMALCGPALFWPAIPHPNTLTDTTATAQGWWAQIGRLVTGHPRVITLATLVLLVPLAVSAASIQPSFDDLKSLPASAPSVRSYTAYSAHFKDSAQVHVLLSAPGHDLRQSSYRQTIETVATKLAHVSHVTSVQSPVDNPQAAQLNVATDGSALLFDISLDVDPSSLEARQAIDALSAAAAQAQQGTLLQGATVLIGGQSASVHDQAEQFNVDFTRIVLLVCLAIALILALLVRSVTAPIYLLGTIALSALTAVGITNLVYHVLLGKPLFSIVPIFAFVFLVSLGEDFNILTIARIREEVKKLGNRQGIATAIALTGGVVSSCGLVMAASFSRLTFNEVGEVAQLGFTVVVGVLLDTFVVRPLLVPAIATMLGHWNWVWPGKRPL